MLSAFCVYRNFLSFFKSAVLLDTMYDILPIAQENTVGLTHTFHLTLFVTGLYLDKQRCLWQYIVEV